MLVMMPAYVYRAYDRSGRIVKGTIDAPSEAAVHERLAARGVMSFEVLPRDAAAAVGRGSISGKLLPLVTRQLATVLSSGTPLAVALRILSDQPVPPGTRALLRNLEADVRAGVGFADALARHPGTFSEFYVQLVRVGEETGDLVGALERVADYLEKVAMTRAKIIGSLIYPASVLAVGLGVTFGLLRFVVPQFAEVLEGFGSELPAATQFLLSASEFVQRNTLLLLMPFLLAGLAYWAVMRSRRGREAMGKFLLSAPVIGGLVLRGEMATVASTLATAVNSGASLVAGLDLATGSTRNWFLRKHLVEARAQVERGRSLREAFGASGAFASLFVSMVGIGEEAGNLTGMLEKVALFFDREVEAAAGRLVSMLQPAMILVLGFLVGGLAYALFAPVFSLVTAGQRAF